MPDAAPGSPDWDRRTDLAARATRLICDGVVQREGVSGLASRLGCSQQHLTAVVTAELGADPIALARADRLRVARLLVEQTELPLADVVFALGFAGEQELDNALVAGYGVRARVLRSGATGPVVAGHGAAVASGPVALRLPVRAPMDGQGVLSFLVKRAVPGVEHGTDSRYGRTLALPHGPATVWLHIGESAVDVVFRLSDVRDLGAAVSRVRRLVDADADPVGIDGVLAADQALAAPVLARPGVRVPGAVDGAELVLRAVLGQQVSVAAARTTTGRLAEALGTRLPDQLTDGRLARLFPSPGAVAERGTEVLTGPRRRINTILAVAAALAGGELQVHAGRHPDELSRDLQTLPGIGPWTAGYVALRVLGATDVLLTTDLMVRRGAKALGLPSDVRGLNAHSRRWSPFRSYAGMHLWRASALTTPAITAATAPAASSTM